MFFTGHTFHKARLRGPSAEPGTRVFEGGYCYEKISHHACRSACLKLSNSPVAFHPGGQNSGLSGVTLKPHAFLQPSEDSSLETGPVQCHGAKRRSPWVRMGPHPVMGVMKRQKFGWWHSAGRQACEPRGRIGLMQLRT